MALSIFLVGIISAQGVSYCCEKTVGGGPGGYCIDAPQEKCDTSGDLRAVPTSCEATSYCRLGVCINSKEGTCMPNTPQRVCDANEGVWDERDKEDIPQCQLGCCLIGEQAAFVTLTRCKSLSSLYGLETNYRTDIQSEVECITSARPKVKGACVYEKEFESICEFLTKKECQEMQTGDSNAEFHQGYLCSAESLGTVCGPRGGTTCVEGRDEVYFLDTCGNLANVYDNSKLNVQSYWEKIMAPDCGSGSNEDSPTCGDCDYYLGSTCKKGSASYGNYICEDLSCTYEGESYSHGETWCADAKGIDESLPGSRHFRLVCYNNEVSVEPCADFRQEVCIQSSIGDFKTAACRVNLWQTCYSQDDQQDCENLDKRDCEWVEGISILVDEYGESSVRDDEGDKIDASCFPKHSPGFDFWGEGTEAENICSTVSTTCIVQFEKGLGGSWKIAVDEECKKRCEDAGEDDCEDKCKADCLTGFGTDDKPELNDDWTEERTDLCYALGDCGISVNYVGAEGYYDEDDLFTISETEEEE